MRPLLVQLFADPAADPLRVARRPPAWSRTVEERVVVSSPLRPPERTGARPAQTPVDMESLFQMYHRGISELFTIADPRVWRLLPPLKGTPQLCVESVLRQLRCDWDPVAKVPSMRRIFDLADQAAAPIRERTHCTICVEHEECGLGPGTTEITIKKPDWAWVQLAKTLAAAGHALDFEPRPMFRASDRERVYGAGPATGSIMEDACKSCPPGGVPGLVGLSWDGSPLSSRLSGASVTSIYLHFMNCVANAEDTCMLLGFLPDTPPCPTTMSQNDYANVKLRWLQECISNILDTLVESASTSG
jgi:hypothetical protein